jgi:hypothetical protein
MSRDTDPVPAMAMRAGRLSGPPGSCTRRCWPLSPQPGSRRQQPISAASSMLMAAIRTGSGPN